MAVAPKPTGPSFHVIGMTPEEHEHFVTGSQKFAVRSKSVEILLSVIKGVGWGALAVGTLLFGAPIAVATLGLFSLLLLPGVYKLAKWSFEGFKGIGRHLAEEIYAHRTKQGQRIEAKNILTPKKVQEEVSALREKLQNELNRMQVSDSNRSAVEERIKSADDVLRYLSGHQQSQYRITDRGVDPLTGQVTDSIAEKIASLLRRPDRVIFFTVPEQTDAGIREGNGIGRVGKPVIYTHSMEGITELHEHDEYLRRIGRGDEVRVRPAVPASTSTSAAASASASASAQANNVTPQAPTRTQASAVTAQGTQAPGKTGVRFFSAAPAALAPAPKLTREGLEESGTVTVRLGGRR